MLGISKNQNTPCLKFIACSTFCSLTALLVIAALNKWHNPSQWNLGCKIGFTATTLVATISMVSFGILICQNRETLKPDPTNVAYFSGAEWNYLTKNSDGTINTTSFPDCPYLGSPLEQSLFQECSTPELSCIWKTSGNQVIGNGMFATSLSDLFQIANARPDMLLSDYLKNIHICSNQLTAVGWRTSMIGLLDKDTTTTRALLLQNFCCQLRGYYFDPNDKTVQIISQVLAILNPSSIINYTFDALGKLEPVQAAPTFPTVFSLVETDATSAMKGTNPEENFVCVAPRSEWYSPDYFSGLALRNSNEHDIHDKLMIESSLALSYIFAGKDSLKHYCTASYIKDVLFFRKSMREGANFLSTEELCTTSIIFYQPLTIEPKDLTREDAYCIRRDEIVKLLRMALLHNHKNLILYPLCHRKIRQGIFSNIPFARLLQCYQQVLNSPEFQGRFSNVRFAVDVQELTTIYMMQPEAVRGAYQDLCEKLQTALGSAPLPLPRYGFSSETTS